MKKFRFTLLELIITLGILAALTSLLLDNFADIKLREKEAQNISKGELIKSVLTGNNVDEGYSQFLSDIGKRPQVLDTDEGRLLAQLYDRTLFYHNSDTDTMFYHADEFTLNHDVILDIEELPDTSTYSFPTLQLSVGWNGPYINLLKSDNAKFYDAWGNDWKIIQNAYQEKDSSSSLELTYDSITNTVAKYDEIDGIASLGADNLDDDDIPTTETIQSADQDNYFFFPHDDNLATLNVTLKIRDEDNPKVYNSLTLGNASTYSASTTYAIGDVVTYLNKYYTCLDSTSSTPTDTTNWSEGVPANWVSEDSVRLLIFAPAVKNENSSNTTIEAGFFRLSPFDSTATGIDEQQYPTLKYSDDTNVGWATSTITDYIFGDNQNENRGRVKSSWDQSTNLSNFKVEWLIPGKRKIYAFIGFYNSVTAEYYTYSATDIEWLDLKRGENYITLYLDKKY